MQSEVELSRKTLIRVKRKRGEERVNASKKCKFVGSCDTNDDNNAYQLLDNGSLNGKQPQQLFKINDFDVEMICDENVLNRLDLIETQSQNKICCNDELLEVVDNNSCDFIYDIYLYDNLDNDNLDNNYRECDDDEPSSNDENYAYNDYPDDSDVEKHNEDNDYYYDAFDDEDEVLLNRLATSTLKSDDSRSESDSDDYLAAKQYSDDNSSCDDC